MLIRILVCIAIALLNTVLWLILNSATLRWNPVAVGGVIFVGTLAVMLFMAGANMVNKDG